jgi:hypothetical protein
VRSDRKIQRLDPPPKPLGNLLGLRQLQFRKEKVRKEKVGSK